MCVSPHSISFTHTIMFLFFSIPCYSTLILQAAPNIYLKKKRPFESVNNLMYNFFGFI